jgi:hypothetical protein
VTSSSVLPNYVPTVSYSRGPNLEGLGAFFLIMLMVIGLPLIVLTPLAVIFAPLFFVGCIVCLLIGCLKG